MKIDKTYLAVLIIIILVAGFIITRPSQKRKDQPTGNNITFQDTPTTEMITNTGIPAVTIDKTKSYTAILNTSSGNITVSLNAKTSPITVGNFVSLARKNFYSNTIFHRVIKGFMIQGGDPKGDGTGGPDEYVVEAPASDTKYARGIVAMAKKGLDAPGTSGSQFFIMQEYNAMPPEYAVLGQVESGMDIVDKIANAPVLSSREGSTPVTPVTVKSVTIIEK
jgi:cyclophilin family peptidyl-prolyl cis-trans isomerase